MSPAALSMFVFGIYVVVVGIGYIFIPNKVLPLFGFPKTEEPWLRVLGIIVLILGFYYIGAAQNELTLFFWMTIIGRFTLLIGFVLLVVFKQVKPQLILFGLIDAAGAVWTMLTM